MSTTLAEHMKKARAARKPDWHKASAKAFEAASKRAWQLYREEQARLKAEAEAKAKAAAK